MKKLQEHKATQLPKEVPFYLLLTYRLHMMEGLYKCNESKTFVKSIVIGLEQMNPQFVTEGVCSLVAM